MKCLGKVLISILVIVIVIVVAGAIVLNLTPEQLGFADMELFEGQTLRDLGLANVKLIAIGNGVSWTDFRLSVREVSAYNET